MALVLTLALRVALALKVALAAKIDDEQLESGFLGVIYHPEGRKYAAGVRQYSGLVTKMEHRESLLYITTPVGGNSYPLTRRRLTWRRERLPKGPSHGPNHKDPAASHGCQMTSHSDYIT